MIREDLFDLFKNSINQNQNNTILLNKEEYLHFLLYSDFNGFIELNETNYFLFKGKLLI